MKKVAFFNRPLVFERSRDVFEQGDRFIDYGILTLATYLASCGFEVKIFDYYERVDIETKRRIKKELLSFAPDLIGLSAFTTDIYNAHKTAGFLKKVFGGSVPIVLGGPHISALPKKTMKDFTNFDIGVFGEGELTLTEIVKGKPLRSIKGVVYRDRKGKVICNPAQDRIVDLDKQPLPDYGLFDLEKYVQPVYQGFLKFKKRKLVLPVETSRGCPFACKFCFRTVGKRVRLKSPKRVVEEIERIIEKYRVDQVEIIDGTFGISRKHALSICRLLCKKRLNRQFKFLVRVRANTIDAEVIAALHAAGCYYLSIGIEAADDFILKKSGKGITTAQIREALSSVNEVGIETHANFILGLPFETEEHIYEKVFFAKSLPVVGANFAILVPFPGTEIYRWAKNKKMGYRLTREDYRFFGKQAGEALVNQRISRKRLLKLQKYCYREFYLSSPKRFLVFLSHLNLRRLLGIFSEIF
jgi:magnesium-protoporphyrin IX monomethyl ester (oxidative) cyclase